MSLGISRTSSFLCEFEAFFCGSVTSSFHFHFTVPRSSYLIGLGKAVAVSVVFPVVPKENSGRIRAWGFGVPRKTGWGRVGEGLAFYNSKTPFEKAR